jgi:TonB dependent receptor/Carboxypeptidase regulatory-like domain
LIYTANAASQGEIRQREKDNLTMSRLPFLLSSAAVTVAVLAGGIRSAGAQTTTTGAVQGVVTDESTGAPMLLVTVVAASPALQGQQSEFTDASGQFFLSNLPPGTYSFVFIYGDAKVRRENITVSVGKLTKVNAKINQQSNPGEVITIKERAPTIDSGSTKQGTTLEQDYLTKVPQRGRTYDSAAGAAAGAQADLYGVSFGGSTSVENNYVVDGINTTGLSFGTVGSPLLNNFIQEIEVITGGYNAEFGRATGGVVNVVTKTGSNEFHGSVWGQFVPLEATRESLPNNGNAIVFDVNHNKEFDFGFELGGPVIKDRVWFYVGFAPTVVSRKIDRIVQTRIDRQRNLFNYGDPGCTLNADGRTCDGDENPNTNPSEGCELTSSCEGDNLADRRANGLFAAEEIDRTELKPETTGYQFLGKLNFAVTPDHQGQISMNGNYSYADNNVGIATPGTLTAQSFDRINLTTDLAAKWTSKFNDNKTQVDLVFGWHRFKTDTSHAVGELPNSPGRVAADQMRVRMRNTNLSVIGRNPDQNESDEVLQFCDDGTATDQFPGIANCPVTNYAYNSLGLITDQEENRYTAKGTITQRVKLAGHHQFKLGGDFEQNVLDEVRGYFGGGTVLGFGNGAEWDVDRYIKLGEGTNNCPVVDEEGNVIDANVPCSFVDENLVHGVTQNWSAFLQDSWSILPNLTVNLGLRYEEQRLKWGEELQSITDPITGQELGANAMELTGMFAPRLGVIYDWTKEGRSKVYLNYGRFYESIPMDLNTRALGGEVRYQAWYDGLGQCGAPPGDSAPRLPSLPENCVSTNLEAPALGSAQIGWGDPAIMNADGTTLIMPGMKAQYMDEIGAGVEYELLEDLRVGLSYQNRRLGRAIEDMSTDGAHTYFIGNPGEFDEGAEADLVDAIAAAEMDGNTEVQAALEKRLALFQAVRTFDKPTRDYHAVTLTAAKRFSKSFMVQASYTYSRLRGNYPGLFSPDTGQLDPNISSQYDLLELLGNRFGAQAADRPHNFKIDGYYTFDFADAGRLTAGARLRGISGVPLNYFGTHRVYGPLETLVLPRGAGGRTPFTVGTDLQLSYARRIGKMDLEVYIQLLDVLNLQQTATIDDEYTTNNVYPIVGGTTEDLPYLKDYLNNTNAQKKLNYGNPDSRTSPLLTRVGATLSF